MLSLPSELQWFYLVNHRPHAGQALPKDLLEIYPICKLVSGVAFSDLMPALACYLGVEAGGWRLEELEGLGRAEDKGRRLRTI